MEITQFTNAGSVVVLIGINLIVTFFLVGRIFNWEFDRLVVPMVLGVLLSFAAKYSFFYILFLWFCENYLPRNNK